MKLRGDAGHEIDVSFPYIGSFDDIKSVTRVKILKTMPYFMGYAFFVNRKREVMGISFSVIGCR